MKHRLCRIYHNVVGRFYKFQDGTHMRVLPTTSIRSRTGTFVRTDERGVPLPRVRMSKKQRLRLRRQAAAAATLA